MRASSLSDKQVHTLLCDYFVPVWLSIDDYTRPKKSKEDADELDRIRKLARGRGLASGTVCAYLIAPDGDLVSSMIVSQAMDPKKLAPWLREVVTREHLQPRRAESIRATATPRAAAPKAQHPDGLLLHVYTRHIGPKAYRGTTEDVVELEPAEWASLVPPEGSRPGGSWDVPRTVLDRLYRHFYPALPNYKVESSEVRQASLTVTLSSVSAKEADLLLRGALVIDHRIGNAETDGQASARLVGRAVYDPAGKTIRSFQLVSERADYTVHWSGKANTSKFNVAVEQAE